MKGQATIMKNARSQAARDEGSTDNWQTPPPFLALLNEEFGFTLDPCADAGNAAMAYFDIDDDGLAQDWSENICFVNFPYSQAKVWSAKCIDAATNGATVVVLCAARTDTPWWQNMAAVADEVRFVKGRLKFTRSDNDLNEATYRWLHKNKPNLHSYDLDMFDELRAKIAAQGATFPSSVIVLRPDLFQTLRDAVGNMETRMTLWDLPVAVRR